MNANKEFECCQSLGCKMGHTLKAMIKKLRLHFEENNVDLTMEQYFILNILDSKEGLILQDIADMLERDKSAVVRHINALEEKHFVARATCYEDKRKKLLFLTKPGMKTLGKAQDISAEAEAELIGGIDKEHLEVFEQVLVEIVNKTQNDINC